MKRSEKTTVERGTWYLEEPRGTSYRALLAYAVGRASQACIVSGVDPDELTAEQRRIEASLAAHLAGPIRTTKSWPGTRGTLSRVLMLRYTRKVAEILGTEVEGWFDWQDPRPEDLSLLKGTTPWLSSVAHERLLYVETTRDLLDELLRTVPGIQVKSGPGFRGGSR